jgi:hypothetical protein
MTAWPALIAENAIARGVRARAGSHGAGCAGITAPASVAWGGGTTK